ncbi:hypothetical protein IFM89_007570, partial [Coptis chinensis]
MDTGWEWSKKEVIRSMTGAQATERGLFKANALGATVIGTVSIEEKAAQAKEDGCHHIIISTQEDFVAAVSMITSGKGVDVVYNSLGKDTFQ